jgi:hypothetical protein
MFPVCSQISSAQWKNYSHGLVRSSATDSLPIILAIPNPSAHTKWQFESARSSAVSRELSGADLPRAGQRLGTIDTRFAVLYFPRQSTPAVMVPTLMAAGAQA